MSGNVRLAGEAAPYLTTVYGKALDSRSANPILGDTFADQAVRRIDFDFTTLKLPSDGAITLPMRAKHLDGWTRQFLAANPHAVVLHLGCGLDTRVYRIDPPASVSWFDIDLSEVIELRAQLYEERRGYEMIAASVTDRSWLDAIPAGRPVLAVAEGLMMYLPEHEGIALFNRITAQFPSGELLFDAYSRLTTRVISLASRLSPTQVRLQWGIEDPRRLERQVNRLVLVDDVPFLTLPELVSRLARTRAQRAFYRLIDRVGWMRHSIRHLRYRF
jgi:O-methyltransferase involved in polyketide biosynthesis